MYWIGMLAVCGVVVMAVFGAVSFCFVGLLAWYWAAYGIEIVRGKIRERRARNATLGAPQYVRRQGVLRAVRNGSVT